MGKSYSAKTAIRASLPAISLALLMSSVLSAQPNTWIAKAPMAAARSSLSTGVIDGILYAAGGFAPTGDVGTLEAYDPKTNTWTTRASMRAPRSAAAAAEVAGILYVLGGQLQDRENVVKTATVEAYDPKTNTWTGKPSMPTPRNGLAAAVVDGILYAVGGHNDSSGFLTTVEAYDPKTNTWTTKAPMLTARSGMATVALGGMIYAVGGATARSHLATVEVYDPKANTWSTKAPMPTGRAGLAAAAVDGILYAAGGGNGSGALATVEAYDPKTDTWSSKPPLPTSRLNTAGGVVDDTLYVLGGFRILPDFTAQWLSVNEAFTPFLTVSIDIKPGDPNNTINLKSNGRVDVAILSSATFDATSVDPSTVTLAGAHVATQGKGAPMISFVDVNGDHRLDMLLHFRTDDLQLTKADTQAVLKGQTFGGQLIRGSDSIRIVP